MSRSARRNVLAVRPFDHSVCNFERLPLEVAPGGPGAAHQTALPFERVTAVGLVLPQRVRLSRVAMQRRPHRRVVVGLKCGSGSRCVLHDIVDAVDAIEF